MYADGEKGGVYLSVCMCMWFMIYNYYVLRCVIQLGLIKYIAIVIVVIILVYMSICCKFVYIVCFDIGCF